MMLINIKEDILEDIFSEPTCAWHLHIKFQVSSIILRSFRKRGAGG